MESVKAVVRILRIHRHAWNWLIRTILKCSVDGISVILFFLEFFVSFSKKKKGDVSVIECFRPLVQMAHKFGSGRRSRCRSVFKVRIVATRKWDAVDLLTIWLTSKNATNAAAVRLRISQHPAGLKPYTVPRNAPASSRTKRQLPPEFQLHFCAMPFLV